MNHLLRHLAPLTEEAWTQIDDEARRILSAVLGARSVVDFLGPSGWTRSSVDCGRIDPLPDSPENGVSAGLRSVKPLVELRAPFDLDRTEIENAARGATNIDLGSLDEAARRIAVAENRLVFHGFEAGRVGGLCPQTPHPHLPLPQECRDYPPTIAEATRILRGAGVGGPYAIALGERGYTCLLQATQHGFPVLEVVRQIVGGPVVHAPALDGAVLLSQRGGDFELTVGQDFAVGYANHTSTQVSLYLTETLTFRVLEPEAAIWLPHAAS